MIGWRGGSHHPSAYHSEIKKKKTADCWLRISFFFLPSDAYGWKPCFFPPPSTSFSLLDEPRPRAFSRVGGVCPCGRLFSAFLVSFLPNIPSLEREIEKEHDPFFVRLLPYLVRLQCGPFCLFSLVTWTLDSWTPPPMEYKSDWLNRPSLFNAMGNGYYLTLLKRKERKCLNLKIACPPSLAVEFLFVHGQSVNPAAVTAAGRWPTSREERKINSSYEI